jgi:hypothetical protein
MDYILSSNEVSTLIRGLANSKEDLSYSIPASFPSTAKSVISVLPSGPATYSTPQSAQSEVLFNIPRGMFLDNLLLEHQYTTASGDISGIHLGKTVLEYVELVANNKVVFRCTDGALVARIENAQPTEAWASDRITLTANATTYAVLGAGAATTGVCFTPIFTTWFESIRNSIDLSFVEQLTLRVRYNTQGRAGNGTALATVSPRLWVYRHTFDKASYDTIRASNISPSSLFNQLCYNTFMDKVILSSTTRNFIRINANFPVYKLHFFIKPVTTGFASGTVSLVNIDSFQFQIAGQDVYSSTTPSVVVNYDSMLKNSKAGQSTETTVLNRSMAGVCTLEFGSLYNNRQLNSGCMSLISANNPTLWVNHQPTGITAGTSHELWVIAEYWQIVSIDSRGTMQVSVSN